MLHAVQERGNTLRGRGNALWERCDTLWERCDTLRERYNTLRERGNTLRGRGNALRERCNALRGRCDTLRGRGNALRERGNPQTPAPPFSPCAQLDRACDSCQSAERRGSVRRAWGQPNHYTKTVDIGPADGPIPDAQGHTGVVIRVVPRAATQHAQDIIRRF